MYFYKILILFYLILQAPSLFAYLGPGMGLGAFITMIAFFIGVLLLIIAFVWFPIKRWLKKKSKNE